MWSPRQAARILLLLLLQYLDQGDGPLVFGIDETLERRRGPKIKSLVSRVNYICRFLLPHQRMSPKTQHLGSPTASAVSGIPTWSWSVAIEYVAP